MSNINITPLLNSQQMCFCCGKRGDISLLEFHSIPQPLHICQNCLYDLKAQINVATDLKYYNLKRNAADKGSKT